MKPPAPADRPPAPRGWAANPPRLEENHARRLCKELRSSLAETEEQIALFESGTVDYLEKPGGGRTAVNEYTLRRLYRERDGLAGLIENLEGGIGS